ncbi:MAG: hypothetical protein GX605_06705 [Chloroflexi bacterium]|nr:hypothetical protein [Chloroflexota bacterium]
MTQQLLLVAHNAETIATVQKAFSQAVAQVFVARDAVEAMLFLDRQPCDVVLIEVESAQPTELALCSVIRKHWDAGVFLLLHPPALTNVVLAFRRGAEAYVSLQDLEPRELVARVLALGMRVHLSRRPGQERRRAATSGDGLQGDSLP